MIELWRGCANAWECDELGHLNVRFYLAKAWEAVGDLADRIGMPDAFQPSATSTLRPSDITVRYLAELRPGAPIFITGGVTQITPECADIVLIVHHSASGKVAAVFRMTIDHCLPAGGGAFNWPQRAASALEGLRTQLPEIANTRSLTDENPSRGIRLADADQLGLAEIGRGRINPEDCDFTGLMMPEHLQGKVSNSVANYAAAFPEQFKDHAGAGGTVGGALLEGRIAIRRWPQSGEGYTIRTGLRSADRNVRKIVHWVFDRNGRLLWSMEGVAAIMDLKARKLVKADDATLAAFQNEIRKELRL
ncbi:acyl-ACP thioesterase [Hyphobacterium sp. HN65]|uniref:Acyl-ACP thioesterase n=1 Tax=Hyphobacterium lacteum TaxID=3116575 RepID=A0ABU7LNB9_9PROT|nr:acyl-ACP thioesterase [Hyphobacterium sp. HN65]MEE2525388.1 acyl-ACP thioesterase [Hyphobacterium sp. HN65]